MVKKLLTFFLYFFVFSCISISSAHAAVTWSETRPAGDQNRGWATASISSDGQTMLVGNQDGGLFISTNGGSSWTQISPSGYDTDVWYVSAMSADGRVILAGIYGGYLYLSRDGGSNWSEARPAGSTGVNWINTSMSSDGQVIFVSYESGRLYRSVDSGSNWSEIRPLGDQDLTWHTAISDNGKTMLASEDGGSGGRLYISRDTGSTWTETQPAGNVDLGWTSMSVSADGKVMLAAAPNNALYLSRDGGSSWAQSGDASGQWNLTTMSPDGLIMFVSDTTRLYISQDTGNTWTETQPAGDIDKSWQLMGLSGSTRVLLVGSYDGRVYIGSNPALTVPDKLSSLQCTVSPTSPDLFQINTSKSSAMVYFAPVGNASNYKISYGYTPEANEFSVKTNLGASTGVLSYTVNNLPANKQMYFKVYSQNDCASGTWSNTMAVKTDGKVYYKNLLSSVLSVLPKQTTNLTSQSVSGAMTCSTYTVQAGDSLWSIASQKLGKGSLYGQIKASNNLNSIQLHIGQTLKIGC